MNKYQLQAIIIRLNEIKNGYKVNIDEGVCGNLRTYYHKNKKWVY